MQCTRPFYLKNKYTVTDSSPQGLLIPCGKCLGCRIARSNEWAMRAMHELEFWETASFITLTYEDKFLPKNFSVSKYDLQCFFKRLRKHMRKDDLYIKYYACGEYGDLHGRPHYHAIVFGFPPDREDVLFNVWGLGRVDLKSVNRQRCKYISKYIDKLYLGDDVFYDIAGISKPFLLISKGLGFKYVLKYYQEIADRMYISVNGVKHGVPRYYRKLMNLPSTESEFMREKRLKKIQELLDKGYLCVHHIPQSDIVDSRQREVLERLQRESRMKTLSSLKK